MSALIVVYLIIAFVSLLESNWPRALYWVGASIITFAVLLAAH